MITQYSIFEANQQNPREIYDTYYSDLLSWEEFVYESKLDPTSIIDDSGELLKIGKYVKWIMGIRNKERNWEEDKNSLKEYLTIYDRSRNSGRIEDTGIFTYKSIPDLYDVVRPFIYGDKKVSRNVEIKSEEDRLIEEESKLIYEDDKVVVRSPLTYEASCLLGADTSWCTATRNTDRYFLSYSEQSPLYIFKDKKTKRRFQIHFQTDGESRDESNRYVSPATIFELFPQTIPVLFDLELEEYGCEFYTLKTDEFSLVIQKKSGDILIGRPFIGNSGVYEDSSGKGAFLYTYFDKQYLREYINSIDVTDIITFSDDSDDYWGESGIDNHIKSVYRIWGFIENKPEVRSKLSQIEDLSYDESNGSFTLILKNLKKLSIIWEDSDAGFDTIEKVLSEDYYGDEIYYGDDSYYGNEMDELTSKEYNLIKDIIKNHKDEIENYDEIDFEDEQELKDFIEDSSDEIASVIKNSLVRARISCEETEYYNDVREFAKEKSYEWLTGQRYYKDLHLKWDNGYKIEGIRKELVIGALSMVWGARSFEFEDRISYVLDDSEDYEKIDSDLSEFVYWSGDINQSDFIDQFIQYLDIHDVLDDKSYQNYKQTV